MWEGEGDGKEDGDCEGQLWKVNVSAYDPKVMLLGSHFVTPALMSSDCIESSNKRISPLNPSFGEIVFIILSEFVRNDYLIYILRRENYYIT